jgi:hypothetical protein
MPEVGGERADVAPDVLAALRALLERADREGPPQVVEPRQAWTLLRTRDTGHLPESAANVFVGKAAAEAGNEQVLVRDAQPAALLDVAEQSRVRRFVERQQAALAELGAPHDQAVRRHVSQPKVEGFGDAQTGARQQAEKGEVSAGSERVARGQPRGGIEQVINLIVRKDIGSTARSDILSEDPLGWNFVRVVFGAHVLCEPDDEPKPPLTLPR